MVEKIAEKERALSLRRKGLSYSEILKQVPVAKSTLSLWLQSVGLSLKQEQRLTQKKLKAMERGWTNIRNRRIAKSERIKEQARDEVRHLVHDPLWLTGVILYWAEGKKERVWRTGEMVAFSNMDAAMHKIFLRWLLKYTYATSDSLMFEIYIHENADVQRARGFWAEEMKVPGEKFKVYFKKNKLSPHRKNVNEFYFGLLCVRVRRSIDLNRKIAGWIEGVIKYL